jgi:hypothetical protein
VAEGAESVTRERSVEMVEPSFGPFGSRIPRFAAALVLAVALVAPAAAVATPLPPQPSPEGPPVVVLPHPPPIAGTFTVSPSSGPVGTTVTVKGLCGFAATGILYGVSVQTPTGTAVVWLPPAVVPLQPTPLGTFAVTFKFPAVGNVPVEFGGLGPIPITPGTYRVGVVCFGSTDSVTLPFQPFTVIIRGTISR